MRNDRPFYSPTNTSDETDITTFCHGLFSLVRRIPKYNILIIGWDMKAKIGKDENNKFCLYHQPNSNGEYVSLKNNFSYLNI